jgi:hypothetical protein
MITKEWLADQIKTLNNELTIARQRRKEADIDRIIANDKYVAAKETEETLEGCIRGLRDELRFLEQGEA